MLSVPGWPNRFVRSDCRTDNGVSGRRDRLRPSTRRDFCCASRPLRSGRALPETRAARNPSQEPSLPSEHPVHHGRRPSEQRLELLREQGQQDAAHRPHREGGHAPGPRLRHDLALRSEQGVDLDRRSTRTSMVRSRFRSCSTAAKRRSPGCYSRAATKRRSSASGTWSPSRSDSTTGTSSSARATITIRRWSRTACSARHDGYVTDIITERCIEWLRSRAGAGPFCLLCHHKAPHFVWEPDSKHEHAYDDAEFPLPETFDDEHRGRVSPREADLTVADMHEHPTYRAWPARDQAPSDLTREERKAWNHREFMKDVLGCIDSVDENVGRLLDELDRSGLAENTLVVYTSDNGYFLGEHGWTDKKVIYEESIRVPLLVRYPAEGSRRRTVSERLRAQRRLHADVSRLRRPRSSAAGPREKPETALGRRDSRGLARLDLLPDLSRQRGNPAQAAALRHSNRALQAGLLVSGDRRLGAIRSRGRSARDAERVSGSGLRERRRRIAGQAAPGSGLDSASQPEMEQDIAEKTMAGQWREEVASYRRGKLEEWERNAALENDS